MSKIIDSNKYKPRIIDKTIQYYLSIFGAVCVEGPKWCGKTRSSSYNAKSEFLLGDPENNFYNRQLAEMSVKSILKGETPRLIDEWQEVPSIWDAVRHEVDSRGEKGQFILTGSSTPSYKGIVHSGAGRIATIRMRTMSLYETGDSTGLVSLKDLCEGKIQDQINKEISLDDLANLIVRGGFPEALKMDNKASRKLSTSYINSILKSDIKRINDRRYSAKKAELLLKSLARNESTLASKRKLESDIRETGDGKIDYDTVPVYLDLFERLFLLDNQPPFSYNVRSSTRIKQSEKWHLCDPSLTCALLNLTPEKLFKDLNTFGLLFEALCVHDLKVYAESFDAKVYYYKDYSNMEADAVIELDDGRWCAFEIKLGANQIEKAAQNLIKLRDTIKEESGKEPNVLCVICGLGNASYKRPDGVYVVPITALKP